MNKIPLSLSALKSPNKIYKSDFKINSLNLSSCAFLFYILYVIIVVAVQKLLQCFLFDFRRFFFFLQWKQNYFISFFWMFLLLSLDFYCVWVWLPAESIMVDDVDDEDNDVDDDDGKSIETKSTIATSSPSFVNQYSLLHILHIK